MQLSGKKVLLTGATGGLGRAIAEALADRDATLLLSSRKPRELDELAAVLPGDGHRTLVSDLAEDGAALRLLEQAGDIDVLVANAGLPASGRLDGFSQEEITRALRVNLESPVRMARELVPRLVERGSGHLVFVSSISGRAPTARASLYAATKFGLRGFALCLREDLRPTPVGVSLISPGTIREAGMYADSGAAPHPLLGSGTPKQVGKAVVSAIERDRGEVTVAPLRQRALGNLAHNMPEISGRIAGSTAARVADEIASGQTDKR
ncbi:MAG TPA: SDR family NAD(P)-dependent oxidoreductase [Solirubrobacterales bacterium]|nr:SDR family NAD(P)-dependent oxidoreductase [Solirubrobacterales bacterium]